MSILTQSGLLRLKVEKIVHETEDAISILLKEVDGKEFSFKSGQFLTFVFDRDGKEIRRCYSIFTHPSQLPEAGIAIKKVPGGFVSDNKMDNLKEGDVLPALVPMGNFVRRSTEKKNLIIFGAGSGITPLLSIIQDAIIDENIESIVLHYVNRHENSIIFRDRLNNLVKENQKFTVVNHITQPLNGWNGSKGRINSQKALDILTSLPEEYRRNSQIFMCGPGSMMEDITSAALEAGFDKKEINREVFSFAIKNESRLDIEPVAREVSIIAGGRSFDVVVEPGDSILETALNAGIDLPFSCQYGSCTTCKTRLVSGKVVMLEQTGLSDEEIEKGICLTCVGYPASDNVIINYDDPLIK